MRLRTLAWVGPLGEAVAVAQQLAWHARHPTSEPFGDLLIAHSAIYAGALAGAVGAAAWMRSASWRARASILMVGALVRLAALAWDASLHGSGHEGTPAHDLYRVGIAMGVVGFAWAIAHAWARAQRRSERT